MKIKEVELIPYGLPVINFADSYTRMFTSNAVLVKIYTDDGHVGIGEACAWEPEFYGESIESVYVTLKNYAVPAIIGENPFDIGYILQKIDRALARITNVKEGIDLALYDLVGKILKVPVHTLLGGKYRDEVPVGSEIGVDTPEVMVEDALRILKYGIRVIKIKGSDNQELDIIRIKAVREAVGDDVAIRIDPNAAWNTIGTIKIMRALEDCNLQLLEQPIPNWDLKGMAHIRKNINIPLMADESVWTPSDVIKLHDYEAADLINAKIAKTCGLYVGSKVVAAAESVGMPVIAGTELEPGISAVAKVHFAASMRDHPIASEFTELTQVDGTIVTPALKVENGCLKVPTGPGFGVDIDEDVLKECRKEIKI